MNTDVTVVIPTIPPRAQDMMPRALLSVARQEHQAAAIAVAIDREHDGAWLTRGRALAMAQTTWVAFLDDDDEFKPEHLRLLLAEAEVTGADYVFSYFQPVGMGDPLGHFGRPFDAENPHHTTMTVMVKTKLAQSVGFTPPNPSDIVGGEDWRFIVGCVNAGADIVHLPERTWLWHYHPDASSGPNTSGRGDNW